MIWWCERCLCQPTQNHRCVHWDLLRTTREPQMHKHRNSNVIRHLFPTKQIYAHKSFPMLCFGGFIGIIGHLCHSHPVPSVQSLGKISQVLTFGHIGVSVATLPFPNLMAPKPNHVFPWSYLPNLISESFETATGQYVTMFWNMSTWPLSAVWSCWFYREGPLVKHRDCLYNNIATVTFNRCLDCVCVICSCEFHYCFVYRESAFGYE